MSSLHAFCAITILLIACGCSQNGGGTSTPVADGDPVTPAGMNPCTDPRPEICTQDRSGRTFGQ